jgi:hypothetical protein
MQIKSIPWVFGQKISNLLIVDLKIACSNEELSLLRVAFNSFEHIFERTRHDSFLDGVILLTSHCMSLTSSSLAVSKDGSIVTLKHVLNDAACALIVDVFLGDSPIESHIESELLGDLI